MFKLILLISFCIAASALAAPTETPAGQASTDSTTTTTTTMTPSDASSTTVPSSTAEQTSSAPATDGTSKDTTNTTASMPVSSVHDHNLLNGSSSSFTCYTRQIGYYADPEHSCKVYHFCLLGEYNGESVYQRISYLCLNGSVFDQQALDCVESSKMSAPCNEAPNFYDSSNAILRQAIVGNSMHQGNGTEAAKSTTASS